MKLDIFEQEQKYYKEYDTFCYQNSVRQVLEYMKVENAFSYINASLTLVLEFDENGDFTIHFDEDAYGVLPLASKLVYRENDYRDIHVIWEENKKMIKSGVPIIVTTDSYYVPYLPFFQKSHGRHCFIVAGYNEANNNPIVIDWIEPWCYKGETDLKAFNESRQSENQSDGGVFSGLEIDNNWSYIKEDGWDKLDAKAAVRELLEISYTQYSREDTEYKKHGISALKTIVDLVEDIRKYEVEDRKKKMRYLYSQLYWTIKRKCFFSFYIKQSIENQLLSTEYLVLAEKYQELYDKWEKFINFLLKHSFLGKDQSIDKIKEKLNELIEEEIELFSSIEKILK